MAEKNGVSCAKKARVWEDIKANKSLFNGEPQQLVPPSVGVAYQNRKGIPPNMQYVYGNLTHNMKNDGCCASREKVGVVLRYAAGPKLDRQRQHQVMLKSAASERWPPLNTDNMFDFTLANTHINIKLRLHNAGHVDPISGVSFALEQDPKHDNYDKLLNLRAASGLTFYVIDGDQISDNEAFIVSEWFNSDQDQNSASSEVSLIRSIQIKATEIGADGTVVKLASLVQQVSENSLMRLRPNTVASLGRWVMDFMETPNMIDDWIDYISDEIDTGELSASPMFFEQCAKLLSKNNPELKMYVSQVLYDSSVVDRRQRPQPDGAMFIAVKDLEALSKDEAKMAQINCFLRENHTKFMPILAKHCTSQQAKKMLRLINHNIVRLSMGKPLAKTFKMPKSVIGKWDAEKVPLMIACWVSHVQSTWAVFSHFAADAGMSEEIIKLELHGDKANTNYCDVV